MGLSIGISAAVVIYLIADHDLTFDKFHKDGDRIYRVVTNFTFSGQPVGHPGICGPLPGAVKSQVSGLQTVASFYRIFHPDVSITNGNTVVSKFKEQDNVILTDSGYFNLINYKWLAGTSKSALSGPNQVVLTSDQAAKYFPGLSYNNMLGRTVVYDSIRTTVTGIVQSITQNTGFTFHDFISYSTGLVNKDLRAELRLNNWSGTSVKHQLFVKLLPNTRPAQIAQQLNNILKNNTTPVKGKTHAFALQQLDDIHFNQLYGGIASYDDKANLTTLYSLLAIAAFLLLLGCINFINLTTAQGVNRAREIGIRKTMGSSRLQLVTQFLSETFVITLAAVVLSVGMVPLILKQFTNFIAPNIKVDIIHQPGILVFLLILSVIVSLLSGFYPAVILSGYKPVSVLKNQAKDSNKTRNTRMRKMLSVGQFVVAQFFIMATILVSKQIYYATHKQLGFKKDGILAVSSPFKNTNYGLNRIFMDKLRTLPQVEMVSAGNDQPSSENTSSTEVSYLDGKKEIKTDIDMKFGDENYIKVYHIPLLAGRNINANDRDKAFLINATFARMMGFKDPHDAIGKFADNFNGDKRMEIVGVVGDFHPASLRDAIGPLAILQGNEEFSGVFHIALKPGYNNKNELSKTLAGMHTAWKQVYPNDDFNYEFVDETVNKLYTNEQNISTLLSWATGLSILISCLGMLGLAIYTTGQRTKEIGVRKVLGASVAQIVALLSAELLWLILLAFALVSPLAYYAMHKWMQNFADHTTISWWIFILGGGIMVVTTLFTLSFQTIKAAIANPVKSLRTE